MEVTRRAGNRSFFIVSKSLELFSFNVYLVEVYLKLEARVVIRSFRDEEVEIFFEEGILPRRKGWASSSGVAKRKLDMLHYARELIDLRSPPGNKLEALKGNLEGFYSIRINDQWRIVFGWDHQPFDVRIMDYH